MVVILNPNENFWSLNPQFTLIQIFRNLWEKDKESSSQLMWAICLYCHKNSIYKSLLQKEKEDLIAKDILHNLRFNWGKHAHLIEEYERVASTPAEKALRIWDNKILERSEFIRITKYTSDTADMLDKMIAGTKKLYEEYNRILTMLDEEAISEKNKAGREASLSDKGII